MKLIAILFIAILCANASAQTIRSIGYNTTNGQVVANTTNTLTFTNDVKFGDDMTISEQVISGSGVSFSFEDADFAYGASIVREGLGFSPNLNTLWTSTNASNARSAVGLGLPALTNSGNASTMRALAGSTNSNHPFSGTFAYTNPDNNTPYVAVVSNGIILEIYEY